MTRMNLSSRLAVRLAACFGATTCAAIVVVACSSDEDGRPGFTAPQDDSGASLPPVGETPEASVPVDASKKPPFDPKDEAVSCTGPACAVQLVAGENHFCARMGDGTVRCWGDNAAGQLGVVDAPSSDDPDAGDAGAFASRVTDLDGVSDLSAGGTNTCAIVADGGVVCWGGNDTGQLGLTDTPPTSDGDPHSIPSAVALAGAVKRLDVGQRSSCVVLASNETWCWGDNTQRQLARTTETEIGGPAKAELGALQLARTATGTNSGFGVTAAGDVHSWGALGGPEGTIAARVSSVSPDPAPLAIGLGSVTSFSVSSTTLVRPGGGFPRPPPQGVAHACAVVSGDVWCWGVSLMGALGTGLPDPSIKPLRTVVTSETGWPQQVAAAGDITCVRLTDGTVQCAGDNTDGVLGKPKTEFFSMFFRPVPTFTGYAVQVAAASRTVCALAKDGSVQCWGGNGRGELGLGKIDAQPHPSPVSIRF
jgi:alpha-tubulin suppressor-like RCC1 family protein